MTISEQRKFAKALWEALQRNVEGTEQQCLECTRQIMAEMGMDCSIYMEDVC